MFTVVKMGGCNGSGKTSVARALLDLIGCDAADPVTAVKKAAFYSGEYEGVEVHVLGSYLNTCGGMDTISDKHDRLDLIRKHCKPAPKKPDKPRIIFFEGLITGKTYGAIGELSEEHVNKQKGRWLYAFPDTPFETCVERVLKRREAAGNFAPFDPERTLRPTYDSCQSLLRKIRQEQAAKIGKQPMAHPTLLLKHKQKPVELATQVLGRALSLLQEDF